MPSPATKLKWTLAAVAAAVCLYSLRVPAAAGAPRPDVSLVLHPDTTRPEQHGLAKLRQALQQRGTYVEETRSLDAATGKEVIVAGIPTVGTVAKLLTELRITPPNERESLLVRKFNRQGKTVVLVTGADPRGLM
jgi:hypothetical protein